MAQVRQNHQLHTNRQRCATPTPRPSSRSARRRSRTWTRCASWPRAEGQADLPWTHSASVDRSLS
eukprot:5629308-Prymnesium_polylepis.1